MMGPGAAHSSKPWSHSPACSCSARAISCARKASPSRSFRSVTAVPAMVAGVEEAVKV